MTERRGSGEGSIYRFRGGWEVSLDVSVSGGRRVRRRRRAKTKAEALEKLRELQRAADAGAISSGTTTVGQFLDDWLAHVLPARSVTQSTIDNYTWAIETHIKPALGKLRLTKLGPEDIDRLLRRLAKDGKARSSVRIVRTVLVSALTHAERRGYVARNVARLSVLPPASTRESRAMTVEQLRAFLDAASGDRLEAAWIVMVALGLRPGEVLGLRWDDVDLSKKRLRVTQALRREGGSLVVGEPKTRTSRRTLDLPEAVVDAVKAHRKRQAAERLSAGELWEDNDLVFSTSLGGLTDPANFRRAFRRITQAAALGDWHPHELRHTAVSLLSDAGVPLELIADVAGHASTRMTGSVYRHAVSPTVTAHVETMDRLLREGSKRP
ncbi:MAG: site-specific integrase [Acidimicrobiales bacterium]